MTTKARSMHSLGKRKNGAQDVLLLKALENPAHHYRGKDTGRASPVESVVVDLIEYHLDLLWNSITGYPVQTPENAGLSFPGYLLASSGNTAIPKQIGAAEKKMPTKGATSWFFIGSCTKRTSLRDFPYKKQMTIYRPI